jgi:integrase
MSAQPSASSQSSGKRVDGRRKAPAGTTPKHVPPDTRNAAADHQRVLDLLIDASRRLPHSLRNEALVCLLVGTSVAPIEIALLRVRDYLLEDGTVRQLSKVDGSIAYNGKTRPLLFVNERVCSTLDRYLEARGRPGERARDARFRGLNAEAALILGDDGQPLKVVERREDGQMQRICAAIHMLCRSIFLAAGINGLTARDGKKLFAKALYDMGADTECIRVLLGASRMRTVVNMIGPKRSAQDNALRVVDLVRKVI